MAAENSDGKHRNESGTRAAKELQPYRDTCGKCGARRIDNQIGLEETPELFVAKLVAVFREVRRLLHPSGVVFLNLGDSYASGKAGRTDYGTDSATSTLGPQHNGLPNNSRPGEVIPRKPPPGYKEKDLLGIPWLTAFALRADGWWLRQDIVWNKTAPMPESVTDRCTKSHEYVFLLTKSANYFFDSVAIAEPVTGNAHGGAAQSSIYGAKNAQNGGKESSGLGKDWPLSTRNKRSVWTLGPESYAGAHFATMPTKLVEPCILAGSKAGDTVLDPFSGSGTTIAVALKFGRHGIGIDLNPAYNELAHKRIEQTQPLLLEAL